MFNVSIDCHRAVPNGAVKFIASERHALSRIHTEARLLTRLLAMNIIDALSGRLLERNIIAR